jgi:hypothetical protein
MNADRPEFGPGNSLIFLRNYCGTKKPSKTAV